MHKPYKMIEILCLTALAVITLLGVCWGPPGPPSTPVGNLPMYAMSVIGVAAYGFWKMRK